MGDDRHRLYWLPEQPDWSARFDAARAAADWPALVSLSKARLSFRETLKLDQLLLHAGAAVPGRPAERRIAILGTSTTDHLLPGIRIALLRRGIAATLWVGDYGDTSIGEATTSDLDTFAPDTIVFLHDPFALARGISPASTLETVDERLRDVEAEIVEGWRRAADHHRAQVIQQLAPPSVFPAVLGQNEHRLAGSRATFMTRLNDCLRAQAEAHGVACLSLDHAAAQDGLALWHDPVMWHRAKQFVAPRATPLFGDLVARLIQARGGQSAKCLVLDLDNTLWGGVIGDDGVEGIVLGQGSAEGEAFVAFQEYARDLARRGIILAVASKNDEANAREPFQRHPDMILREGDIASFHANWGSKAESLRAIAADLDIGIDALVFVDDNPFERALVRELEPRVLVPEVGDDPGSFAQCLADAGYFESIGLTDEDRGRSALYVDRAARRAAADTADDMAGYLQGLDMRLAWGRIDRLTLPRSAQLIGKTNQFNLTTRRHSEADVAAMIADPAFVPLQFRLVDRFGDNGLIAVVIGRRAGETFVIDTWLMSCRVLRRGVEEATMAVIEAQARALGCRRVMGIFAPTAKNAMVASLYASLGFEECPLDPGDAPDGSAGWCREIGGTARATAAITLDPAI